MINREIRENILYKDKSYLLQGAIFEVYKEMGCGFLEAVYQECLEMELTIRHIPYIAYEPLLLAYKGEPLTQKYVPDFICFDKIIVEIKAVKDLTPEHQAQVQNYLRATDLELGLLVNFGSYPKAHIIRIASQSTRFSHNSRYNNEIKDNTHA